MDYRYRRFMMRPQSFIALFLMSNTVHQCNAAAKCHQASKLAMAGFNACNKGVCINGTSGPMCLCNPGWRSCMAFDSARIMYGPTCICPDCSFQNHCSGHGTCIEPNTCQCLEGYTGKSCDTAMCNQGCIAGECVKPGLCKCEMGWNGQSCESDTNECGDTTSAGPCHNLAKCINTVGSFICECITGYGVVFGSNICDSDWHEFNGKCWHFSTAASSFSNAEQTCVQKGGHLASIHSQQEQDFTLQLMQDYNKEDTWIGMEDPVNNNTNYFSWTDGTNVDYMAPNYDFNLVYEKCVRIRYIENTWWDRKCSFNFSFICLKEGSDGIFTCNALSQCPYGSNVYCHLHASCGVVNGQKSCECNKGFFGDGYSYCEDLDECQKPDQYSCPEAYSHCVNNPGGYECACNDGYYGDGLTCTRCNEGYWGPECQNFCKCKDDHTCDPVTGYCESENCVAPYFGESCDEIHCAVGKWGYNCKKECHCKNNEHCNKFTGECPNGCASNYSSSDITCSTYANQRVPECHYAEMFCGEHYSVCVDNGSSVGSFFCFCKKGFEKESGTGNCAINIDDCAMQTTPCGQNGHCTDNVNGYTCSKDAPTVMRQRIPEITTEER